MNWINILHLYQPPTQEPAILDKIVKESYLEIIKILKKHSDLKFTVNICGCLTWQLMQNGHENIINEFKILAENKQIELMGTAAYHPILPLMPATEIKRQIEINQAINQKYFGQAYQPKGFFLPEMAYSAKVAKIIKQAGFKWIVLDEISLNGKFGSVKDDIKYIIKNLGLQVIFRNRKISKTFVPATLLEILKAPRVQKGLLEPAYVYITATDGELYGHHHQDWENKLDQLLDNNNLSHRNPNLGSGQPLLASNGWPLPTLCVNTLTVSEYLKQLKQTEKILPVKSTWESSEEELKQKNYYSLWNDPKNKLHAKLWQLANLSIKLNEQHQDDVNHYGSRLDLEKGIASCAFWWCSDKKPSPFCPPTWNPDEVEKGVESLIRSIRALDALNIKYKQQAEKLYLSIKKMIWQRHWEK